MRPQKQKRAGAKRPRRSFDDVVGAETYAVWVSMLRELVPQGRTHRLSVVLAAMLHYAASVAEAHWDAEKDKGSLASALLQATQMGDPGKVEALIHDAVAQLFHDAQVQFERTSARGTRYSIAEEAFAEFIHWYDMPWE